MITLTERLLTTDRITLRVYGASKIHKTDNLLRIIVSCINSPLYNLSLYLHQIIKNCAYRRHQAVENSFYLVEKLNEMQLEPNYTLVSLDVISLFTNVPINLVIKDIQKNRIVLVKTQKYQKRNFNFDSNDI